MNDNDTGTGPIEIDKVRASKAGHAFHEAWAARTALELLPPSTDLTSITLEGFDERDEQSLGTGAVEIADLARTTAPPMLPGRIESRSFSSNTRSQAPTRQFVLLTWHQLLPSLPRPMQSFGQRTAMIMFLPWSGMNLLRTGPSTRT